MLIVFYSGAATVARPVVTVHLTESQENWKQLWKNLLLSTTNYENIHSAAFSRVEVLSHMAKIRTVMPTILELTTICLLSQLVRLVLWKGSLMLHNYTLQWYIKIRPPPLDQICSKKGLISILCYFQVTLPGLRDLDFLNSFTTLVLNEVCKKELRWGTYNFGKRNILNRTFWS